MGYLESIAEVVPKADVLLVAGFLQCEPGIAIPYGIYDLRANAGSFHVGDSHDTPQFAVDCIASWWQNKGQRCCPEARELVILADAGGSNGYRCRAWKYFLQHHFANRFDLTIP